MKLPQSSPSSISPQAIRILIADRNRMGNQLLAESLGRDPRFEIIAAAAPADILSDVTTLQPDLAVISADFEAGAKKGLQVARTLTRRDPSVRIVILLEMSTRESVIAFAPTVNCFILEKGSTPVTSPGFIGMTTVSPASSPRA